MSRYKRTQKNPNETTATGNVARWDMDGGPLAVEISEGGVATLIHYTTHDDVGPQISSRVHVYDADDLRTMADLLSDAATDLDTVQGADA